MIPFLPVVITPRHRSGTRFERSELLSVSLFLLGIALLGFALLISGCAARQKTVTGLPAGVTAQQVQSWDTAVANLDKIAQVTSAMRQSVFALHVATVKDASGETYIVLPDGPAYIGFLNALGKIDQAELDATTYLKAQPKNWGANTQTKVRLDIALINAELQAISSQHLTGVKNAGAVQQIQQLITQISNAASVILALIA